MGDWCYSWPSRVGSKTPSGGVIRPVSIGDMTSSLSAAGDGDLDRVGDGLGCSVRLSKEDLTGRNLNTQITTSDHDTVGRCKNLVKVLNTLLVLNIDEDLDVGTVGTHEMFIQHRTELVVVNLHDLIF